MGEFTVGQRICVKDDITSNLRRGMYGTVITVNGGDLLCKFDEFTTGHDGNTGSNTKDMWYVDKRSLAMVPVGFDEATRLIPEYNIGQNVYYNDVQAIITDVKVEETEFVYSISIVGTVITNIKESMLLSPHDYRVSKFKVGTRVRVNENRGQRGFVINEYPFTVKWDGVANRQYGREYLEILETPEFKTGDRVWYKKRDGVVKSKLVGTVADDSFMPRVEWSDGTKSVVNEGDIKLIKPVEVK